MVIIPQEELSLTDKKNYCERALQAGIKRALELSLAGSRGELTFRHAENTPDFGCTLNAWWTQTLAAVPGPYTVFNGAAGAALVPRLGATQVAVFYKASVLTVPNPFTILRFGVGPTAGAPTTTKGHVDLEQVEGYLTQIGFLSEPIPYDRNDWVNICVENKINTAAQEQLVLGCYIIEPVGGVIS